MHAFRDNHSLLVLERPRTGCQTSVNGLVVVGMLACFFAGLLVCWINDMDTPNVVVVQSQYG